VEDQGTVSVCLEILLTLAIGTEDLRLGIPKGAIGYDLESLLFHFLFSQLRPIYLKSILKLSSNLFLSRCPSNFLTRILPLLHTKRSINWFVVIDCAQMQKLYTIKSICE
jgi:hypothetical protein